MQTNSAQTDRKPALQPFTHTSPHTHTTHSDTCTSWCSHFVVRGTVLRCRPGNGCTNNRQVIITWRRKGTHKVSPLMMMIMMLIMMIWGRRCHSRGSCCRRCRCRCCCCCMLVLLMAAVRLEFRAWYAQLFDLGQIGFHTGFANCLLFVRPSAC